MRYTTENIRQKTTIVEQTHESVFRSYHILERVKIMIKRGDSLATISEFIEDAEQEDNPKFFYIPQGPIVSP